ncbi:MAG: hypothetical protein HY909_12115 [Deltaproteobacteria bacterium]|nr:hypothetical protein [Deltaproteobacteria bacterium]
MLRFLPSVAVWLLALLGCLGEARAQSVEDYRRTFEEGVVALQENRFNDARLAFERCDRERPSLVVRYNLGLVYRALGRHLDAIRALEDYADSPEPNTDRARIQAARAMAAELRATLVRVTFYVTPPTATLQVDGEPRSLVDHRVQVDPGLRVLSLEAEGYRPWRDRRTFRPGARETFEVNLERLGTAAAPTPTVPGDAPTEGPRRRNDRWWVLPSVVGGAVVVLGVLVAVLLVRPEARGVPYEASWGTLYEPLVVGP